MSARVTWWPASTNARPTAVPTTPAPTMKMRATSWMVSLCVSSRARSASESAERRRLDRFRLGDDGLGEDGVGERHARRRHARVVVADDLEQLDQVAASPLPVRAGGAPDRFDEPDEGVLDMAAQQVDVRDEDLRVDVVGVRRGYCTSLVDVDVRGPPEQAHLSEAHAGQLV